MRCKNCGATLNQDSHMCKNCGANIDFTDGGQSFYYDDELDEWKTESFVLPKTEIRELNIPHDYKNNRTPTYVPNSMGNDSIPMGGRRARRRAEKGSKGLFSRANRVIATFSVFAVVAVLACVGSVAKYVMPENPDIVEYSKDVIETQSAVSVSEESTMTANEASASSNADINSAAVIYIKDLDSSHNVQEQGGELYDNADKKIKINSKFYNIDGHIYIPMDDFLEQRGYKYSSNAEEERNNQVDYTKGERTIRVIIGTKNMYIIDASGSKREYEMSMCVYNDKTTTYVPAAGFFKNLGMDFSVDNDGNMHILAKK